MSDKHEVIIAFGRLQSSNRFGRHEIPFAQDTIRVARIKLFGTIVHRHARNGRVMAGNDLDIRRPRRLGGQEAHLSIQADRQGLAAHKGAAQLIAAHGDTRKGLSQLEFGRVPRALFGHIPRIGYGKEFAGTISRRGHDALVVVGPSHAINGGRMNSFHLGQELEFLAFIHAKASIGSDTDRQGTRRVVSDAIHGPLGVCRFGWNTSVRGYLGKGRTLVKVGFGVVFSSRDQFEGSRRLEGNRCATSLQMLRQLTDTDSRVPLQSHGTRRRTRAISFASNGHALAFKVPINIPHHTRQGKAIVLDQMLFVIVRPNTEATLGISTRHKGPARTQFDRRRKVLVTPVNQDIDFGRGSQGFADRQVANDHIFTRRVGHNGFARVQATGFSIQGRALSSFALGYGWDGRNHGMGSG
mmetsp:Transcript_6295/g.16050  ORF Transcript_6295/g.16050 Transcript_6295/m.16050 type:complete len:412 (+) Transcript_6295:826-2061(+)